MATENKHNLFTKQEAASKTPEDKCNLFRQLDQSSAHSSADHSDKYSAFEVLRPASGSPPHPLGSLLPRTQLPLYTAAERAATTPSLPPQGG